MKHNSLQRVYRKKSVFFFKLTAFNRNTKCETNDKENKTKQKNKTVKNVSATWRAIKRCRKKYIVVFVCMYVLDERTLYTIGREHLMHSIFRNRREKKIYLLPLLFWMKRFDLLVFACGSEKACINDVHCYVLIYASIRMRKCIHINENIWNGRKRKREELSSRKTIKYTSTNI